MSCVSPARSAGAFGSWTTYFGAFGSAWTSVVGAGPPWLSPPAASPFTEIVAFMPASACPGMEQMNESPSAGTVTTADAVSPALAWMVVPSGKVMSWRMVPVLTSLTS